MICEAKPYSAPPESDEYTLLKLMRNLISLLEAPEPGLISWHEMRNKTARELRNLLLVKVPPKENTQK